MMRMRPWTKTTTEMHPWRIRATKIDSIRFLVLPWRSLMLSANNPNTHLHCNVWDGSQT